MPRTAFGPERGLVRRLQASAAADNAERVALRITVPDQNPTPTDLAAFDFFVLDTATPYVNSFNGPDGGKNAHYIARWVNNHSDYGPWSEFVSVTVGA